MKIALYNRVFEDEDILVIQQTFQILQSYPGIDLIVFKDFYERVQSFVPFNKTPDFFTDRKDLASHTDFLISLGGDGTMLDAVCFVGDSGIPLLGINLGRLGFLADVQISEVQVAIAALVSGAYSLDYRTLIHLDSNLPLFDDTPFGLNEFTIHRKDAAQMIKIHTFINGEFLNTYWADGLMVSTPTGSTGYSLSCNGPIIFPQTSSFLITAVAPHNLNIRPVVVPDNNVISFEVEGRTDHFLCTLDSRLETITKDIQLAVKKENFSIALVKLQEQNFLSTMRKKLYWGIDSRNPLY